MKLFNLLYDSLKPRHWCKINSKPDIKIILKFTLVFVTKMNPQHAFSTKIFDETFEVICISAIKFYYW